ncbi:MAG: hypothetical protein ACOYL5_12995 [Phototrophicaceae bacterium]
MSTSNNNSLAERWMGWLFVGTVVVTLVGYSLPWLQSIGVALQPNAFDLAEWMTLHPFVRANGRWLLPALLLRLPLVLLGWSILMALLYKPYAVLPARLLYGVVAGVALALIPAIPFFQGQTQDANYQQQFGLWVVYLIGGISLVVGRRILPYREGLIGLASIGVLCALVGVLRAYNLLAIYQVPLSIGGGCFIYTIGLLTLTLLAVTNRPTNTGETLQKAPPM